MSRAELKSKVRENAVAWAIIALLSSGGGSAVTSLRGPSSEEINALQDDVHAIKINIATMNQKLDSFILYNSRELKTANLKK